MQDLAGAQAMIDLLHDHRVRPRLQLRQEPVGLLLMPGFVGYPGTKRHLLLDVGERGCAIELDRIGLASASPRLTAERKKQAYARRPTHDARLHRICPTLVES